MKKSSNIATAVLVVAIAGLGIGSVATAKGGYGYGGGFCDQHPRMMRGWSGKRIAYLSIIGFFAVLFTYFGVNYLPGLHSYGAS